jgi:hypothetical protein
MGRKWKNEFKGEKPEELIYYKQGNTHTTFDPL